jgi:hypothetical protein
VGFNQKVTVKIGKKAMLRWGWSRAGFSRIMGYFWTVLGDRTGRVNQGYRI